MQTSTVDFSKFRKYSWLVPPLIVAALLLYTRLPLFLYHFDPVWTLDSHNYVLPYHQILEGKLPDLSIRTPGYPLFIGIFTTLFGFKSIPHIQILFASFVSVYFIAKISRHYGCVGYLAAFGVSAYILNPYSILQEISIMPNMFIPAGTMLILGHGLSLIKSPSSKLLLTNTLFVLILISIRPAAIVLLPVSLVFLLFSIRTVGYKKVFLYASIIPIYMAFLASYNLYNFGIFSQSPFSSVNFLGVSSTFWETDKSFDNELNEAIIKQQKNLTEYEKRVINYDIYKFGAITDDRIVLSKLAVYQKYFDPSIYSGYFSDKRTIDGYKLIKDTYSKAISSNPRKYIDFITTNMAAQPMVILGESYKMSPFYYYKQMLTQNIDTFIIHYSDYKNRVKTNNDCMDNRISSRLESIGKLYSSTFKHADYFTLYFLSLILLPFIAYMTRPKREDIIFCLSILAIPLITALMISMSQTSLYRYVYTYEFLIYLSIAAITITLRRRQAHDTQ